MLYDIKILCGFNIWLIIHQILMASVITISIVSLLVILSDKQWKWVDNRYTNFHKFIHSICGITTIGLAFIQVR